MNLERRMRLINVHIFLLDRIQCRLKFWCVFVTKSIFFLTIFSLFKLNVLLTVPVSDLIGLLFIFAKSTSMDMTLLKRLDIGIFFWIFFKHTAFFRLKVSENNELGSSNWHFSLFRHWQMSYLIVLFFDVTCHFNCSHHSCCYSLQTFSVMIQVTSFRAKEIKYTIFFENLFTRCAYFKHTAFFRLKASKNNELSLSS